MLQRTGQVLALVMAAALVGCTAEQALRNGGSKPADVPQGLSLTIYSSADPGTFDPLAQLRADSQNNPFGLDLRVPGYGVVRDTRKFQLHPGTNSLQYTDVAEGIDPTTVSLRTMDGMPDLTLLEQNFRFDLINPDKLLKKYIGQQVTVTTDSKAGGSSTIHGTLLSSNSGNLVLRTGDGTVRIVSRGDGRWQIGLAQGDAGLITKPTLELLVQADKAQERTAQVTYQTDNLTWRADYSLLLNKDDTAADLSTWVTLVNQSGANYPRTQLKLIAGDVRRFSQPSVVSSGGINGNGSATFAENPFFEYHLYTLGRTVDLPNNSIKQVELISPRKNLAIEKVYVFDSLRAVEDAANNRGGGGGGLFTDNQQNGVAVGKIDVCVKLPNTQANHMGVPMPAGRMRVYKKDLADGAAEFVGEDVIGHTPKNETVTIVIGKAFDIVGTRVRTNVEQDGLGHIVAETFEIVLRNHKTEAVNVVIRETPGGPWAWWWNTGGWRVSDCTDKFQVPNTEVLLIPVEVPKDGDNPMDGQKKVTFTLRYNGH
jgi:hypothetical protein